ncbi:hypothetical protein Cfor_10791 [Coptotermes formosanus]|jgi:hypothetical protein|uniref:Uncharacterized protein n=1 Tax=Coptotermes formosanus TaxID=36987 RepID=A0A6L2Q0B4_COPFO|nr:hypothetical protein Cfor_10791 [Coptotermes formosanus]
MVLLTMIARISDGLPLAATMQEDEQVRFVTFFCSNFVFVRRLWLVLCNVYYIEVEFVAVGEEHTGVPESS